MSERERVDRIWRSREREVGALAIGAPQHRVRELARADAVTRLRELDSLSDRGVRRNRSHAEQLIRAKPEQIDEIGIEPRQTTADAIG